MTEFYKLNLLGVERDLPILPTPSGIMIAGFNPVGDMEIISRSGEFMSSVVSQNNLDFDLILTSELKGLPVAQELARLTHKDYVCLRKDKKCYMLDPIETTSGSITSKSGKYFVSVQELEKLSGKKVLFVDDVFSSGSTFSNVLKFAEKSGFSVVAGLFMLKEGVPEENELEFKFKDVPVTCCGFLPLP